MSAAGRWLDLASIGLGVLAAVLGVSYAVEKAVERQRRAWAGKWTADLWGTGNRHSDAFDREQPVGPGTLGPIRPDLSSAHAAEAEEIGAEEILAASPGGAVGRVVDAGTNLLARTRRATGGHRWIQVASTVGVLLLLTCLGLVLFVPLLLTTAFGYVSDSGHDIRLRITVVLFLVDLALQVIANV